MSLLRERPLGIDIPDGPEAIVKRERSVIVWVATSPDGNPVVIKLYRHRGLVNTIRGWAVKYRTEREYDRLCHLYDWNIPCTQPISWTRGYSPEHAFYEVLTTGLASAVTSLSMRLKQGDSFDLQGLFTTVHRMHECGFLHQALYARNIIVNDAETKAEFIICDVPRSRIFPRNLVGTRLALLDLKDLVASLVAVGVPWDQIPVDSYGLEPAGMKRLSSMVAGNRKSTGRRVTRDIESRVKYLAAYLAAVLSGRPTTMRQ